MAGQGLGGVWAQDPAGGSACPFVLQPEVHPREALPPGSHPAPEPRGPSAKEHPRSDVGTESAPGPAGHSNGRQDWGEDAEGGPGLSCYQLYYINAFGVALLLVRMNYSKKIKNKKKPSNREPRGDSKSVPIKQILFLLPEHYGCPAAPLRAGEQGKGGARICPLERPLELCRGEATCGPFKPQPSKPPGSL